MRSEFGQRLLQARKHAQMTQVQAAKAVGMSQGTYAELEKTGNGSSFTVSLAKAYGVNPEWLATGSGEMLPSNVEQGPDIKGSVPLISWVQAGYGMGAVDNLQPGEGERVETTYKVRRHTYALRVKGDSMEPKFPEGCIVIVEPEDNPTHGKFVIVRRNGDEPTLKQYIEEGGNRYLKPMNTRYPIEVMKENDAFCGVVKRLEMDV